MPWPALIRYCLVVGLAITISLYFIPFFLEPASRPSVPPDLAWAPGYWEISPLLGIVRIVPLARANLVNPAANAAPEDILTHKSSQDIGRVAI